MEPFVKALPPVIFGTSSFGNLFVVLSDEVKLQIVTECIRHTNGKLIFDSAGKYGAGLALESLGKCLRKLGVAPEDVIISNKLGWMRTELKTPEPTFEPGVWRDLKHDAIQNISFNGIIECFEQGNELLGGYIPAMVSVHDPDEYLSEARSPAEYEKLYGDILEAYGALEMLKKEGRVRAIGIGAKNWRSIARIANDVNLDWVMIANSMTIKSHPRPLLDFMRQLEKKGVQIINSAVFHSGYLTGGDYFDYKLISPNTAENRILQSWREVFFKLCADFKIKPAEACVRFALMAPGVKSIALSTTNPNRVKENVAMAEKVIPQKFWLKMISEGLVDEIYFNNLDIKS
ncbi:MAG: aldo/keto reductase [Bacteroidota bacterium]|nr:aldo/keto reductase [Bacteroidota bacterium]